MFRRKCLESISASTTDRLEERGSLKTDYVRQSLIKNLWTEVSAHRGTVSIESFKARKQVWERHTTYSSPLAWGNLKMKTTQVLETHWRQAAVRLILHDCVQTNSEPKIHSSYSSSYCYLYSNKIKLLGLYTLILLSQQNELLPLSSCKCLEDWRHISMGKQWFITGQRSKEGLSSPVFMIIVYDWSFIRNWIKASGLHLGAVTIHWPHATSCHIIWYLIPKEDAQSFLSIT